MTFFNFIEASKLISWCSETSRTGCHCRVAGSVPAPGELIKCRRCLPGFSRQRSRSAENTPARPSISLRDPYAIEIHRQSAKPDSRQSELTEKVSTRLYTLQQVFSALPPAEDWQQGRLDVLKAARHRKHSMLRTTWYRTKIVVSAAQVWCLRCPVFG